MAKQPYQSNEEVTQSVKDAQDEQRKAAEQAAKRGTEEARKSSEETLKEVGQMKPVPDQEEIDRIKLGASEPTERKEEKATDGPAQRAYEARNEGNEKAMAAIDPVSYQTRSVGRPRKS